MTSNPSADAAPVGMTCLGAILAGGQSSRMGEPKAPLELGGRSLIGRVADRLRPQVDGLFQIGGDPAWGEMVRISFLEDRIPGSYGPLAGLMTALAKAEDAKADQVILVATDMPFLPLNLVDRLQPACLTGRPAVPVTQGRQQPLASLWPMALRGVVDEAVRTRKCQSFRELFDIIEPSLVPFEIDGLDPFFNINAPSDLEKASKHLRTLEK